MRNRESCSPGAAVPHLDNIGGHARPDSSNAGCRSASGLDPQDPQQLNKTFVGRRFDGRLLGELPIGVDPCGEHGEFHTFCYRCPQFTSEIPVTVGDVVKRNGFWFADLRPAETCRDTHPG